MTVAAMIEILKTYPNDMKVVIFKEPDAERFIAVESPVLWQQTIHNDWEADWMPDEDRNKLHLIIQ